MIIYGWIVHELLYYKILKYKYQEINIISILLDIVYVVDIGIDKLLEENQEVATIIDNNCNRLIYTA